MRLGKSTAIRRIAAQDTTLLKVEIFLLRFGDCSSPKIRLKYTKIIPKIFIWRNYWWSIFIIITSIPIVMLKTVLVFLLLPPMLYYKLTILWSICGKFGSIFNSSIVMKIPKLLLHIRINNDITISKFIDRHQ